MAKINKFIWSEILLLIGGAFLVLDALVLRSLTFDYARFGLAWLDPFISHMLWGILFIIVALIGLRRL